jgi:hypothetical protein
LNTFAQIGQNKPFIVLLRHGHFDKTKRTANLSSNCKHWRLIRLARQKWRRETAAAGKLL